MPAAGLVARMVVDLAVRMVFSRATDWVDPSVVIWAVLLVDLRDDWAEMLAVLLAALSAVWKVVW